MKFLILLLGFLFQINNIACKYENNLKKTDYSNLENIIENYKDQISVSVVPLENEHSPFYFNKSGVFVSASMIKLLILCELIEQVDRGNISLDYNYTYKIEDKVGGAGIIQFMEPGTIISYDNLALYMIKHSDNIATNVLIDILGKDNINQKSKELGLKSAQLNRKMMTKGTENFISSEDIEVILKGILYKTVGSEEMCDKAMYYLLENADDDGIARGLPNGTKFAHKTGSLVGIRHDGGIVFIDNKYIITVLTKDFINEDDANYLMGNISSIVYEIITTEPQPETDTSDAPESDTSDGPKIDTSDEAGVDTSDGSKIDTSDAPESDTSDGPKIDTSDVPITGKSNYSKYSMISIILFLSLLI